MRVIIAGGGTGGHIFPAISIAERIMETNINNEVLFIGTIRGMEGSLIPEKGFNIEFIRSYPILGKSLPARIKGIVYTLAGIYDSFKIFASFRPDIVVGVGGYVSGPAVLGAFLKRIPRVICEQNSVPGITNRFLSRFANAVFITFEHSRGYLKNSNIIFSGNPIRKKFPNPALNKRTNHDENKFNILVLGGSQGARRLNELLPEVFSQLIDRSIKIVHQTGASYYESVKDSYSSLGIEASVNDFIDNMEDYYSGADLVIARSGAGTVSEICAVGRASLLIPYPHATHNHQYYNALELEKKGAAVIIKDSDCDVERLASEIGALLDHARLKTMADRALELGKPQAAGTVVENIYRILNLKPCTDA